MNCVHFILIVCTLLITSVQVNAQVVAEPAEDIALPSVSSSNEDAEEIFELVDVDKQATFPGGMDSLYYFVSRNVVYPAEAVKKKIQGKVFVQFTVNKEGKTTDIHVIKSVHPLLDAQALKVVQAMPLWIPAEQKGKKVNIVYRLPVHFRL